MFIFFLNIFFFWWNVCWDPLPNYLSDCLSFCYWILKILCIFWTPAPSPCVANVFVFQSVVSLAVFSEVQTFKYSTSSTKYISSSFSLGQKPSVSSLGFCFLLVALWFYVWLPRWASHNIHLVWGLYTAWGKGEGSFSALPMQGVQFQSLVRELRSHLQHRAEKYK